MSLILLLLLVLLTAAGIFYYVQNRRVEAAQAAEPRQARPSEPALFARLTDHITQSLPVMRRASSEASTLPPDPRLSALQGNLAQTPLHDFLQYLSLGRKGGILELASGRRTGRMVLQGGRIGKASFRGREGLEAAFLMLDLAEGDFEFHEEKFDETVRPGEAPARPLEVVDVIMLWMERKPKKKQAAR